MTDLITHIRSIRSDDEPMLRSSWSAYRTPPSTRLETDDGPGLRYATPFFVPYRTLSNLRRCKCLYSLGVMLVVHQWIGYDEDEGASDVRAGSIHR